MSDKEQARSALSATQPAQAAQSEPEFLAVECGLECQLLKTQAAQGAGEVVAPKLIGWRTENFLWETDDVEKARNWEPNIGVLPIFVGDPNTKLYTHPIPAQPAPVVPEGWKLVPMKCDEAMKDVGIQFEFATVADGRLLAQTMWSELLAATPTPPAQAAADARDAILFDALRDNSWDLVCFEMPTGGGDADIGWRVIEHHMAKPTERVVGEVFKDDPRAAIAAALATHQQRQDGGEGK